LAAKYRPKKLENIVGQPVVVQAFTNTFLNDTLYPAYILAGTWGVGKTSVGRILAAMLNCETGKTLTPCGQCNNCKEIFSGKSADVKEINAADNRGIDDIRALKQELGHSAISSRKKIIILDECHSLTGAAAEAALKMIEEPPANVMFILATTEAHKITDTIKSRCILWRFKKIDWRELYDHLVKISKLENFRYEDEALRIIAKNSEGSARNAVKGLQTAVEYVSGSENVITAKSVMECLGLISETVFYNLFKAIGEHKVDEVLSHVNDMFKYGNDIKYIIWTLHTYLGNIEKYRGLQKTLMNAGGTQDISDLGIFDDGELAQIKMISQNITGKHVEMMRSILLRCAEGIDHNFNPLAAIEGFAIQSCFVTQISAKK
jgi:DNA polymerase-3 subunit gamma/tau